MLMVRVAKQKSKPARKPPVRRAKLRVSLPTRSVREDHYMMLLAAQY
jgi:hypothetical protein